MQKLIIAFTLAVLAFITTILSRIPKGMDWVMQYYVDSFSGMVMLAVFFAFPCVVLVASVIISDRRCLYLPCL
ncbi:MAG: hypothetical protein AAF226_15195, partial [Verrucomicrobiota bacterium]